MPWDPDCYHRFQSERFAPFEDLLRLVQVRPGLRVVDLGCGTGELTRRLADALPGSDVLGIDTSREMLNRASAVARPGLRFEYGSIQEAAGSWDLVWSHAAIQWVDDHHQLIPRLLSLTAPGGQLAVQLPSNHGHASHIAARRVASDPPFFDALQGWTRKSPVLNIDEYAGLLYQAGAQDIIVMERIYPHVLESADAVADWNRGTALVPYLERLPESLREPFFEAYRNQLRQIWSTSPVFFPFRRILFSALRP